MSVYINVTNVGIPGQPPACIDFSPMPVDFEVINDSTENVLIQGFGVLVVDKATQELSTLAVPGTVPVFTSFTSSVQDNGNGSNLFLSGNIVANQTVVAGGTGSYQISLISPNNPFITTLDGFAELQMAPVVTFIQQTASFPAITGSSYTGIGNATTTITSSLQDFYVFSDNLSQVKCTTPTNVWALDTNSRPVSYYNFDTIVQTFGTRKAGIGTTFTVPPDLNSPLIGATSFTSSNTAIATVVQSGPFGSITGSVGNAQLTAGGGAVSFVGGTGSVLISNEIAPGITGSVEITVVDSLPVAIEVSPSVSNVKSAGTIQLTALVKKANGKVEDITNSATWSTSNLACASVSAGLVTATTQGTGLPRGTPLQSANITATYLGIQGTATITVVAS